ncbi:MAG: HD domain-containing protein [Gemmatimonadetes bacterium]|nr:HD domain-containing protein [Gemmatimonadota bacterium]
MTQTTDFQLRGRQFLQAMYASLQALRLYPLENLAVQNSIDELHDVVRRWVDAEGQIEMRLVGDFFFLNEIRIRLTVTTSATFGAVLQALKAHGIGSIAIRREIQRSEWPPFLSQLLRPGEGDDPFAAFLERMHGHIQHIDVRPAKAMELSESEVNLRKAAAKRTYVQSVKVARDLFSDLRASRPANVRKVKRGVQELVDQVLGNEPWILGTITLRRYEEIAFTHAVNVCILSLAIGKKLVLQKRQLYELGLAGLLHDVGQLQLAPEVLAKEGKLTPEEWTKVQQHPTEGFLNLFEMHGFGELPMEQLLVAYEHHRRMDGSGYPGGQRRERPAVYARIVAVAEWYDASTLARGDRKVSGPPDRVLQAMRTDPSWGLDPVIVRVLSSVLGVYPVGTLTLLNTGELAVVLSRNPKDRFPDRPVVGLVAGPSGEPLAPPLVVDLAEEVFAGTEGTEERVARTIAATVDPHANRVDVGAYFL